MRLAKEGIREMLIATVVLGAAAVGLWLWLPVMAAIPAVIWIWAISFFRDPKRAGQFAPGEMCAPADGTVSEVTRLDHHDAIGGPAYRIGIFLSIFNVHINRAPCAGTVRTVTYKPGEFLDARHAESGARNEANTLLIDPDGPQPGPIQVRQVAGLIARRIICHAQPGTRLARGERFGMIKFGSRTELILPDRGDVDITVKPGDTVRAGLTVLVRRKTRDVPAGPETRNHEGDTRRAIAETA